MQANHMQASEFLKQQIVKCEDEISKPTVNPGKQKIHERASALLSKIYRQVAFGRSVVDIRNGDTREPAIALQSQALELIPDALDTLESMGVTVLHENRPGISGNPKLG